MPPTKGLDQNREIRNLPLTSLEVRRDPKDNDARKIVGYAAVYNSDSEPIAGMFIERIRPGAFDRAIKEKQDVRALVNHDPTLILGRTKAETLSLKSDEKGLAIEITPPDTQVARDIIESIDRGDVDQMSFAFRAQEETWIEKEGETPIRELVDVDLFDVSPVTYPAYTDTEVGLRNFEARQQARETQEAEAASQVEAELDLRLRSLKY